MADVRLIDANALNDEFEAECAGDCGCCRHQTFCSTGFRCKLIAKAPTIDAVPVVRCRECKHWSGRKDKPGEVTAIGYCDHQNHRIMPLNANWFCADGEKMDGGAEV